MSRPAGGPEGRSAAQRWRRWRERRGSTPTTTRLLTRRQLARWRRQRAAVQVRRSRRSGGRRPARRRRPVKGAGDQQECSCLQRAMPFGQVDCPTWTSRMIVGSRRRSSSKPNVSQDVSRISVITGTAAIYSAQSAIGSTGNRAVTRGSDDLKCSSN